MTDAGFGNNSVSIGQRRYLGSKRKLLSFIENILENEGVEYSSFLDIFGGTGVVAYNFHPKSKIIVNDILKSNFEAYNAFFGNEKMNFDLVDFKLNEYNVLSEKMCKPNYFSINFSNTYFDNENSLKIGYIREDIERCFNKNQINSRERSYLITSLIYAMDRIANTVGHYDAFRKIEIPEKQLTLKHLDVSKSKKKAYIHRKDANMLAREISADVTYIDPPYNSRQYGDSYHLLENVVEWKKSEVFGVAKKINRDHIKSDYSMKTAGYAFSDLIENLDTKYILVSYNDMGTSGDPRSQSRITDHELLSALERKGEVKIYTQQFKQFNTGKSSNNSLKERVFFCRVHKKNNIKQKTNDRSPNNPVKIDNIKSPLNYTGGKYRLLPQINKFIPKDIETFYDVFCGAANVGVNSNADKIVCIDKSKPVIDLLNYIKLTNFEDLHQSIEGTISRFGLSQSYVNGYDFYGADSSKGLGKVNKKSFLELRNAYNASKGEEKVLLLLVLVLYGFNNQLRFNSNGEFNLPVGKRDYNGSSRRNIEGFNSAAKKKNIKFKVGDFRNITKHKLGVNDFVYLDPPYFLGLATYNENGGWTKKDELDLYNVLDKLTKNKVRFALSNVTEHKGETNNILINWAKKNKYNIHNLNYDYKNSNYQSSAKHAITKEVLVTNYQL